MRVSHYRGHENIRLFEKPVPRKWLPRKRIQENGWFWRSESCGKRNLGALFERRIRDGLRRPTTCRARTAMKMQLICEMKTHVCRARVGSGLLYTLFICITASFEDKAIRQSKCCAWHKVCVRYKLGLYGFTLCVVESVGLHG